MPRDDYSDSATGDGRASVFCMATLQPEPRGSPAVVTVSHGTIVTSPNRIVETLCVSRHHVQCEVRAEWWRHGSGGCGGGSGCGSDGNDSNGGSGDVVAAASP